MKHDVLKSLPYTIVNLGLITENFEKHPLKFSWVSLALWNVTPQFDSNVEYGR